MVERRVCSFCGRVLEPGTGTLYVKRDGTRYMFCSSKCKKNVLVLRRQPRDFKWTEHYGMGTAGPTAAAAESAPQSGKAGGRKKGGK